jgi:hypothetical protein
MDELGFIYFHIQDINISNSMDIFIFDNNQHSNWPNLRQRQ